MKNKINSEIKWKCSLLKKDFERVIVGYDLRKKHTLDRVFLTSYDEFVRYEQINDEQSSYLSGLNLFYKDPTEISSITLPKETQVIAFDLPKDLVLHLLKGNVSVPHPLPLINNFNNWKFIGFDVVDAITQTSGLYGFDQLDWSSELVEKNIIITINKYGLVDNTEDAIRIATAFDNLVIKHAPFSPCGIWLKDF